MMMVCVRLWFRQAPYAATSWRWPVLFVTRVGKRFDIHRANALLLIVVLARIVCEIFTTSFFYFRVSDDGVQRIGGLPAGAPRIIGWSDEVVGQAQNVSLKES